MKILLPVVAKFWFLDENRRQNRLYFGCKSQKNIKIVQFAHGGDADLPVNSFFLLLFNLFLFFGKVRFWLRRKKFLMNLMWKVKFEVPIWISRGRPSGLSWPPGPQGPRIHCRWQRFQPCWMFVIILTVFIANEKWFVLCSCAMAVLHTNEKLIIGGGAWRSVVELLQLSSPIIRYNFSHINFVRFSTWDMKKKEDKPWWENDVWPGRQRQTYE